MMSLKLLSSILIYSHMYFFTFVKFNVALKWSIKCVQHNFTYFDGIDHFVLASTSLDFDNCSIMLLSSRGWIDSRSIQDQQIWYILLGYIMEYVKNSGVMLKQRVVGVKYSICLWNVSGLIKNLFLLFGSSFLSHSDFCVEIKRNWGFDHFRDLVDWDTM